METDREDPQYLPNHWESAVSKIIADLDNTTGSPSWTAANDTIIAAIRNSTTSPSWTTSNYTIKVAPVPAKVPDHLNLNQPAVNITAPRTTADHSWGAPAVNFTAEAGHHRRTGVPAANITAEVGHHSFIINPTVVPPASPPSVTVIPVLFPYVVEHSSTGGASSSSTANKSVCFIM